MEYAFVLTEALDYKFGHGDTHASAAAACHAVEGRKFSSAEAGIVGLPTYKLLAINGMEDATLPIEDSSIVALQGDRKDLARANWGHMGDSGAEYIFVSVDRLRDGGTP